MMNMKILVLYLCFFSSGIFAQTISTSYDEQLFGEAAYKALDYRGAKHVAFIINSPLLGIRETEVISSYENRTYQYCSVNADGTKSCSEKVYSEKEFKRRIELISKYIDKNNLLPVLPFYLDIRH